jgi:predicted RNase H-like HicB family nuclease
VTLKVLIHKAEEGGYWAEVPALPGCVSQGETMDDVGANVREAIEGWLLAEEGTAQAGAADRVRHKKAEVRSKN